MSSRAQQSSSILFECVVVLCALMFAVVGKTGHHHWMINLAALCWIIASAGVPSALGGGLPVAGAICVGVVVGLISFIAGAIFAVTWTGAFVFACLSLMWVLITSRVAR